MQHKLRDISPSSALISLHSTPGFCVIPLSMHLRNSERGRWWGGAAECKWSGNFSKLTISAAKKKRGCTNRKMFYQTSVCNTAHKIRSAKIAHKCQHFFNVGTGRAPQEPETTKVDARNSRTEPTSTFPRHPNSHIVVECQRRCKQIFKNWRNVDPDTVSDTHMPSRNPNVS